MYILSFFMKKIFLLSVFYSFVGGGVPSWTTCRLLKNRSLTLRNESVKSSFDSGGNLSVFATRRDTRYTSQLIVAFVQ